MFKIIFGILLKMRQALQAIFSRLFEKMRDPKTGKITGITPRNLVMLFWIAGLLFFFVVVASQLFTNKNIIKGGADELRKELTPKIGINDRPSDLVFDEDPLGNLLREKREELREKEASMRDRLGRISGFEGNNLMETPSKDECLELMDRLQGGEDLIGTDKDRLNQCIAENIGGWTEDQLQFAEALLNDPTLSAEERELLRRGIAGQLTPEEMALARALSGNDPVAKALAREILKLDPDDPRRQALMAALQGRPLTDEERKALAGIVSDLADDLNKSEKSIYDAIDALAKDGTFGSSGSGKDGIGKDGLGRDGVGKDGKAGTNGLSPAELERLAAEMAAKENELSELQRQLAEAQALAAQAGRKIAEGKMLTPAEQAAIARLSELQRKLDQLQKEQDERRRLVFQAASRLQKTLAAISNTIDEVVPSSFMVAYEDAPLIDCKTIQPLGKKITRVKTNKNTVLGLDGKPLSPDKVRLLALRKKNMTELEKGKSKLHNPAGESFTKGAQALDVAEVFAQAGGGQPQEISQLIVFQDKSLKPFVLTPDMKIPAVLLSTILVSSKGRPQSVRVKVLDDVYNPESSQLVIPKGSIIVGTSQSFDEDTGVMDLTFDKVSIGSGKVISAKFNVGSADGSMGLRGEIRDTRGKYLLGAFITSFTSGALNWFSQQVIQPFQQSENAGDALLGASLGGGSEVMNKIAEMYAGDLQNAAKIFHVPKGVPLILYPNE